MVQAKINIAIDGYSSCGKSTLAKELARELGYTYIDSGAMYRAITLYLLRNDVPIQDEEKVAAALQNIQLSFHPHSSSQVAEMYLNGENVEPYIRDLLVADKVSQVAAIASVREFAVAQQQAMGKHKGIVMDGRDIGTVVFPDAALKIFMTADPEVRAIRRYKELAAKNPGIEMEEVIRNLQLRDYTDTHRAESPLRQAPDARVLDNSDITREEQLQIVLGWANEILSRLNPES